MRILLCRHAETVDNLSQRIQGQCGGALSAHGRLQAKLLGEKLASYRVSACFCSDLARARETLSLLLTAGFSPATAPVFLTVLREKAAGALEGRERGAVEAAAALAGVSPREFRCEGGGESWNDVRERARSFLTELSARRATEEECVLVLSHGGFIREFLAEAQLPRGGQVDNACIFTLQLGRSAKGGPRVTLVSGNCTAHLDSLRGEGDAPVVDSG